MKYSLIHFGAERFPEEVSTALHRVLEYSWDAEHMDYIATGEPRGHIFESLVVLRDWLASQGVRFQPEDFQR